MTRMIPVMPSRASMIRMRAPRPIGGGIPCGALLKLRAYRCPSIRLGMSDSRRDDGMETSSCPRLKVSFQFAIVLNQGFAKCGDQHAASILTSRTCHRHGLPKRLFQALHQEPGTTVTHP